jgi:nucleoside-diphosphate-sugar epimerase
MKIAIMGANSHLASDLVLSFSQDGQHHLHLFGRRPECLNQWLKDVKLVGRHTFTDYGQFNKQSFDAILNFVGVGDPGQVFTMGAAIYDITLKYDELALSYIKQHPECRYVFMSSGAVYGGSFEAPAAADTLSKFPINQLQPSDWYGAAKLHAECRHRSLTQLGIVDLRVFNYFSCTQDLGAKFFISELLNSVQQNQLFLTASSNMVRDFIGPKDFHQLVTKILIGEIANRSLDCYSAAPVDKVTLLERMEQKYALQWQYSDSPVGENATGFKRNYYSVNHAAAEFNYYPELHSLDNIEVEFARLYEDASHLHAARMAMCS